MKKQIGLGVLAGVALVVVACGGGVASIVSSFPAQQGARIDGGGFVGVETGGAYAWVIPSDTGVVLVDAGMDPEAVALKAEIGGRKVVAVLITHGHLDHVGGLAALDEGAIWVGEGEAGLARGEVRAKAMAPNIFGMLMAYPQPRPEVRELTPGRVLAIDGLEVTTLQLPGHTGGSAAFVIGDTVFTGDAALGHPDTIAPVHSSFCDDYAQALDSLKRLDGVAMRLADGHAGLHDDLPSKLANTLGR